MNCRFVQQSITDNLEHRFDEDINGHLRCCSECRHLCDDLVALEELAQSLGDQYQVPTGFGAKVLAQAPKKANGNFFGFRAVLVPLAIVMLSFGFFWMNDGVVGHDDPIVTGAAAVGDMAVDIHDGAGTEKPSFIEVVIEHPDEGEMIVHLPSVIEIHRTELHEDFYYQTTGY